MMKTETFSAPPVRLLLELIRSHAMHFQAALSPVVSLIAGALILLTPDCSITSWRST